MANIAQGAEFLIRMVKVLMGSSHEGQIKVAPAFFRTQVDLFGPLNSYDPTSKRKPLNYGLYPLLCHHKCHWHYGPQVCGHKSQPNTEFDFGFVVSPAHYMHGKVKRKIPTGQEVHYYQYGK